MNSKEWRSHIRGLHPCSRPDDMEEALLADFGRAEQRVEELEALLNEVLQIAGPQKYRRRRLIKLARRHFAALSPQAPQEVSRG